MWQNRGQAIVTVAEMCNGKLGATVNWTLKCAFYAKFGTTEVFHKENLKLHIQECTKLNLKIV
jgi:hypothetical protein